MGTLLRSEPIADAPPDVKAWRILYLSRDIKGKPIAISGYYAEPTRLKAVVNWGGPVHAYFQRDWQLKALGTREYLFDLFPAQPTDPLEALIAERLADKPGPALAGEIGRAHV